MTDPLRAAIERGVSAMCKVQADSDDRVEAVLAEVAPLFAAVCEARDIARTEASAARAEVAKLREVCARAEIGT